MTPRDDEHDAWLHEALRHAPDAEVGPPAGVTRRILRDARAQASRESARAGRRRPFAALWAALARPPLAAGFASLMVVLLVGVMWWDRPLEDSAARGPRATPESAGAASTPARDAANTTTNAPAPPVVAKNESTPPSARVAKPTPAAPARRSREVAPPVLAQPGEAGAPPVLPQTGAADTPPAADRTENAGATRPSGGVRQPAANLAPRVQADMLAAAPQAKATAGPGGAARAIAALRASIAQNPAAWAWQLDGGAARPLSDAVQAWLAQADAAADSRWRPALFESRDATAASAAARELRLLRDGRLVHVLRLDTHLLRWDRIGPDATPPTSFEAELPQDSAALLRAALDDATR